jgi:hypothetical protein
MDGDFTYYFMPYISPITEVSQAAVFESLYEVDTTSKYVCYSYDFFMKIGCFVKRILEWNAPNNTTNRLSFLKVPKKKEL